MQQKFRLLLLSSCLALLTNGCRDSVTTTPQGGNRVPESQAPLNSEIKKLIDEQKFQAAQDAIKVVLPKLENDSKQEPEYLTHLGTYVKLEMALHGYESAVKFLRDSPRPKKNLPRWAFELIYAQSLENYFASYSWEINKREKIQLKDKELKQWTASEIFDEVNRVYAELLKNKKDLGSQSRQALTEFLNPNTYPPEIRGQLLDSVIHLYVDVLNNRQSWLPQDAAAISSLNLKELLAPGSEKEADLASRNKHPLEKIAALLHDLSNYHGAAGHKEAALDAEIALFEILHSNFTAEEDRELILASFRTTLDKNHALDWYSWGQASYARLIREQAKSDSLIKARTLALEGEQAHPQSIGAKMCRDVVSEIESRAYSLKAMAIDGQNRRSIEVNYKNVKKLFFRSYAFNFKKYLLQNKDYSYWPDYREMQNISKSNPTQKWSIDLMPTTDYQNHRHFVTPPKHDPGFYLVYASSKEDFSGTDNVIVGAQMIFSELVIVKDNNLQNKKVHLQILNGNSGNPEQGVKVSIYRADYKKGPQRVFSQTSNAEGTVIAPESELKGSSNDWQQYFAIAEKGEQFTTTLNTFHAEQVTLSTRSDSAFLFVDRSVYRPGQKLYFKAVLYAGNSVTGDFKINANREFNVSLRDGNGQVVQAVDLRSDSFGAAFGEFVIPTGKLLGQWGLRSSLGSYTPVRVEEYKRPTFEVTFPEQKTNWKLNEKVSVEGLAKYYFGSPVTSGSVDYTVYAEVRFPWWCFYSGFHFFWQDSATRRIVKSGTAKLNADGTFRLDFVPQADKRLSDKVRELVHHYTVDVNVTDEGGETRSQSSSYQIAWSDLKIDLSTPQSFYQTTEPMTFTANRMTLNGSGRAGTGHVTLHRLKPRYPLQPVSEYPLPQKIQALLKTEVTTPGDLQADRVGNSYSVTQHLADWLEGEKVFEAEVTHAATGAGSIKIPAQPAGAYRVEIVEKDSFGQEIKTSQEFLVADAQSTLALPFVALLKESTLEPKGKALLFIHSAYKNQKFIVEKTRFSEIVASRIWVAGRDSSLVEYPVTEADRGGFEINVRMLNDYAFQNQTFSVNVPWTNKALHLEFSKFRDELRPGVKEKWSIKIKGSDAQKMNLASAQVLSFMYDKSLEAIAPYTLTNMSSIYGRSSPRYSISIDLGQAQQAHMDSNGFTTSYHGNPFQDDSMRFESSYGIGGPGARGRGGSFRSKGDLSEGMNEMDSMAMPSSAPMGMAKMSMDQESFGGVANLKKEKKSMEATDATSDKARGKPNEPAEKGSALRTQFQETAFFKPDLLLNKDGGVDIEFTVPDSVTTWKIYALAHTQDMKSGMISKEARTIKDLLIRPYLPRFLREGDRFALKVVVNNASKNTLDGKLKFQIFEHNTTKDITASFVKNGPTEKAFSVPAGKENAEEFTLNVPKKVGEIDIKVLGSSGAFTDGEQKSLMVLPSTLHLAESVFKILKDKDKKELNFKDLQTSTDPTRVNEKLVVTLNSQLFYNVLSALPYLVNYPYECSEQTLNRFMSTGILGSLFKEFPAISKMAKTMSTRSTRLEQWDPTDPNRRLSLEESPWLVTSKGGDDSPENLINVLDERIVKAQREDSLDKLRKGQTSLGGFPWFPGGPPSPYITLYVLHGFSKALEFGVEVPQDMIQRAWQYMHRHYIEEIVPFAYKNDCCWEEITFLNYVLSSYPSGDWQNNLFTDAERKQMADFSFLHWKQHSPYLKGYLSLTLSRMTRPADAKLVWDSVLDSAKVSENEGTHWQREDRSWLWYNDTTETQAFALRTGMELKSDTKLLDGLVLWLFINKKLNHWSSTRSTAEVIYSLAHYLKSTKQLGVREEATVSFGNGFKQSFEFPPDVYMGGKNQIVMEGSKITSASVPITVEKSTPGYMFASATWHYATDQLPKEDKGDFLKVSRKFFKRSKKKNEFVLDLIDGKTPLVIGDEIEVQLSIKAQHEMEYVHLRDPRPSGFEPVSQASSHKWDMGIYWFEEVRDSATNFFFEKLPHGEYNFKYRVRVSATGKFRIGSAEIQPLYAPEFVAHSAGQEIEVKK